MLTPADIDNKQFNTTRLREGYDQDEVDSFLDRVQEDYKFLEAQCNRLANEIVVLKRSASRAADYPTATLASTPDPPTALAEKLLAAADVAAKEHVAEAKAEADRVVREAGAQGSTLIEEASEAAERIKSDGLTEKYRRNEELEAKITKNQQALADVKAAGDTIRRALGDALARYDSGVQQ